MVVMTIARSTWSPSGSGPVCEGEHDIKSPSSASKSTAAICCHLLPDVLVSLSIKEMNLVLLSLTQRAAVSWWARNGAQVAAH